jgi:hypothetical protein
MKYFLFSAICSFSSILSYGQQAPNQRSLPGTYQFLNDDSLFRLTIVLKSEQSFFYDLTNDLTEKSSSGSWSLSRDTLVLNTHDQVNHFRIKVKETETSGKAIKLGDIKTRNGNLIPTALVSINGDTTKLYDPLDTNYSLHPGDIKALSLCIGRARFELYSIKNLRANRFDVMLDMDQSPLDYTFMENAKFLVSQTAIFPIRERRIDSIIVNMDKRIPIALVKIK